MYGLAADSSLMQQNSDTIKIYSYFFHNYLLNMATKIKCKLETFDHSQKPLNLIKIAESVC